MLEKCGLDMYLVGLRVRVYMWSRFKLSEEDARNFIDRGLPSIEKQLGERVYVGNNHTLITDSQLRRELEETVKNSSTASNAQKLASQLKVPRNAIDTHLRDAVEGTGGFFDGIRVIPPKLIGAIQQRLADKGGISAMHDICSVENLTIKAAEHIIRGTPMLTLVGDDVVPEQFLQQHLETLQKKMEEAETPIKYADMEPDERLRTLIKRRLGIQSHKQQYVPQKYVEKQRAETDAELTKNGYVRADDSISKKGRIQLGPYIVTHKFLNDAQQQVDSHLSAYNWFDTRDLPLQPHVARHFMDIEKYSKLKSQRKPAILVKTALERSVVDSVVPQLTSEIDQQTEKMDMDVTGNSSFDDFASKIELPTQPQISQLVAECASIPEDVGLTDIVAPLIRQKLMRRARELLKPRFDDATKRLEAKAQVYLNAAISVMEKNSSAGELVWEQFQQYMSERQFAVSDSPQSAKINVEESLLASTATELVLGVQQRLEKLTRPRDAALILHLAVTLYHAHHFCTDGVLKMRGKAVPKVAKAFDFPVSFSNLRQNLEEADPALIEQVKADALT